MVLTFQFSTNSFVRKLYDRCEQVCKPSDEVSPCPSFPVIFFCHLLTVLLVVTVYLVQLPSGLEVENKGIDFLVVFQAPAVQVCAAHCAETVVHSHYFSVMKSSLVEIYMSSGFSELVCIVESAVGCKRDVTFF